MDRTTYIGQLIECAVERNELPYRNSSHAQYLQKRLSRSMAVKTEKILSDAVTLFLGRDDWTLEEMKDRCTIIRERLGVEVFCIDGVDVVRLYPTNIILEPNGEGGHVLRATRKYRYLPHDDHLADGVH